MRNLSDMGPSRARDRDLEKGVLAKDFAAEGGAFAFWEGGGEEKKKGRELRKGKLRRERI